MVKSQKNTTIYHQKQQKATENPILTDYGRKSSFDSEKHFPLRLSQFLIR